MESTKQNIKTRISCTFCINKYLMTTKTVHYNIVFIERPVGHTMIQPQILPASVLLKLSLTRKPKLVQKKSDLLKIVVFGTLCSIMIKFKKNGKKYSEEFNGINCIQIKKTYSSGFWSLLAPFNHFNLSNNI